MVNRSWSLGRALRRAWDVRLAILIAIPLLGLVAATAPTTAQSQPAERHDEPGTTASLGGRVVDNEGRALAGAHIWLRHGKPAGERFEQTISDENGRYRFAGIDPWSATLAVMARGYALDGVQHFSLSAGQTENHLNFALSRPARVQFRVQDEQGRPIARVELDLLSWQEDGMEQFWFPIEVLRREGVAVPRSDAAGLLTIDNVPSGNKISVRLKHADFAPVSAASTAGNDAPPQPIVLHDGLPVIVQVVNAATGKPAAGAFVSVDGGHSHEAVDAAGKLVTHVPSYTRYDIRVQHPTLIVRSVVHEQNSQPGSHWRYELAPRAKAVGRVVDADDFRPLPGVTVSLQANGNRISEALSDEKGRYEIEGPEGYVELLVRDWRGVYTDPRKDLNVELSSVDALEDVDLFAHIDPPAHGVVVGTDGRPAAGALVMTAGFSGRYMIGNLKVEEAVFTNDQGRFELPVQAHGSGNVHLTAYELAGSNAGGAALSFEALSRYEPVRIELHPDSAIRGRLLGPDGEPFGNSMIQLWTWIQVGNSSTGTRLTDVATDADGRFLFPGLSRDARYAIHAGEPTGRDSQQMRLNGEKVSSLVLDADEVEVEVLALDASAIKPAAPRDVRPPTELDCHGWINSPPLALAKLRGKVVLLDYWGTWAPHCVERLPELQRAHEAFAGKGLVIIGVHHASATEEELRRFVAAQKFTYPICISNPSELPARREGQPHFPSRVLIGRDGGVISIAPPNNFWRTLRSAVLTP